MSKPWFRRNRRGYGPGLPIHRNGWIALGFYVAILVAFPWILELRLGYDPRSYQRFAVIILISIPFGFVLWRKTDAGWGRRDRNFEDD
ncbi:MAG: hypothetical protein V3S07_09775 [Micropepsaceae bacterium]